MPKPSARDVGLTADPPFDSEYSLLVPFPNGSLYRYRQPGVKAGLGLSARSLSDMPHSLGASLFSVRVAVHKPLFINTLKARKNCLVWHGSCTYEVRRVLGWPNPGTAKRAMGVMKLVRTLGWVVLLAIAQPLFAQVQVGENTHMNAGGLFSVGYAGDYGNLVPSSHGLQFGASGELNGYYYNPKFLNFNVTPYYNQSKADSSYQSLTNASGVAATANFFTGSKFPGSVSYRYDYNSTGTLGLEGVPNFTTQGNGQGFGVNWSALIPDWPTLSVGYQHGSGSGTLYGTDQETSSSQNMFNARSTYRLAEFNLNAYYDHNTLNSVVPEFLTAQGESVSDTSGQDFGVNASRSLPWWNGTVSAAYGHSSYSTNYLYGGQNNTTTSGYDADTETVN